MRKIIRPSHRSLSERIARFLANDYELKSFTIENTRTKEFMDRCHLSSQTHMIVVSQTYGGEISCRVNFRVHPNDYQNDHSGAYTYTLAANQITEIIKMLALSNVSEDRS